MSYTGEKDFFFEVSKGNISGHAAVHIIGGNQSVGTTTEDIWSAGGTKTWITSASTMETLSSDVNDTAAGTGAREVTVYGLDASFNEISEAVATNGTTAVTTTASFIRVNKTVVTSAGSYGGNNVGEITTRVSGGGVTQCHILAGFGEDTGSHYTVPAGKTAYVVSALPSVNNSFTSHTELKKREGADTVSVPFSPTIDIHHWVGAGFSERTFKNAEKITEKSDIWGTAQEQTGTGNAIMLLEYDLILVTN